MTTPYNGRLTSLSHGGGCGCKIAPGVLSDILKSSPIRNLPAALLAGSDNNEDAAVYQINENQAIVATTDYKSDVPDDMRDAAKAYYNHLYHEPFHRTVHELLISHMQDMCYRKNVKQVHLQSFVYPVPKTHGLWIEGSLHDIAALQGNDYYKDFNLRNHFGRPLHDRFYQWLRLHLRYYLNNDMDHHSVLMGTEEFR